MCSRRCCVSSFPKEVFSSRTSEDGRSKPSKLKAKELRSPGTSCGTLFRSECWAPGGPCTLFSLVGRPRQVARILDAAIDFMTNVIPSMVPGFLLEGRQYFASVATAAGSVCVPWRFSTGGGRLGKVKEDLLEMLPHFPGMLLVTPQFSSLPARPKLPTLPFGSCPCRAQSSVSFGVLSLQCGVTGPAQVGTVPVHRYEAEISS